MDFLNGVAAHGREAFPYDQTSGSPARSVASLPLAAISSLSSAYSCLPLVPALLYHSQYAAAYCPSSPRCLRSGDHNRHRPVAGSIGGGSIGGGEDSGAAGLGALDPR